MDLKAAVMQRIDLVHASGSHLLELSLDTEECEIFLASVDGIELPSPRKVGARLMF